MPFGGKCGVGGVYFEPSAPFSMRTYTPGRHFEVLFGQIPPACAGRFLD